MIAPFLALRVGDEYPVRSPQRSSRATRPFSPAAQQLRSGVQATVSYEPVSIVRQVRPASVVRSVPVGPTASAAVRLCGSQAAPER
ncbi:hypothetical protein M878_06720 [Streptomyces roseochromogenus subsp. oscitans DS 12.976]|uniref:Uncharacterized protein n=1 Tax=Streptomyces roseochromogenus subsp. oscitans DS 12.976 TaxID=1352936 RepID=V6KV50_STRRC|nr:hypothetical protein M878_06720 [Streptomyces roseochromogenus subsp. oscitans DS 12.976]